MTRRLDTQAVLPEATTALAGLERVVRQTTLEPRNSTSLSGWR